MLRPRLCLLSCDCWVLIAGAIGWATWLFLILAGGLLLAINTSLLVTARHMTRGGIVKAQEPVRYPHDVLPHSCRALLPSRLQGRELRSSLVAVLCADMCCPL
jgi:hypothetical protein